MTEGKKRTDAKKTATRPRRKKERIIARTSDWTMDDILAYDKVIGALARDFGLDTYPNQIELITAEQMLDAYASVGMPIGYHHWSFGKQFVQYEKNYKRGAMGLAYEIVINSDPCIAYLMEENTLTMQALVIAHACYGHNSFFKNNYLFQAWTNAEAIVDYLVFAKNYISRCEQKYGFQAVEETLDACHALMNQGVDRYKHPPSLSLAEETDRQRRREDYLQTLVNDLWRTLPEKKHEKEKKTKRFPEEPQENLLYFMEKHAPLLEPWQREVMRIVRKIAQYFYPQKQTKVMNEGWATFWHYTLINALYDERYVTDEFMIEFLSSHTNVVFQPSYDHRGYSGINPYALGFAMFQDIRRMCENPTEEDKYWFPSVVNTPWIKTLDFAMRNFKDESFLSQYLSPKIIREFKFFSIFDDEKSDKLAVSAIHDERGYRAVREALSNQYNLSFHDPDIQAYEVDIKGDRSLTLRYTQQLERPLHGSVKEVLKHVYRLWQFDVHLQIVNDKGEIVKVLHCPEKEG